APAVPRHSRTGWRAWIQSESFKVAAAVGRKKATAIWTEIAVLQTEISARDLVERVPGLGMPQLAAGLGSDAFGREVMDVTLDQAVHLEPDLFTVRGNVGGGDLRCRLVHSGRAVFGLI